MSAVSVPVNVMLFVVLLVMLATGIFVSMYCTFPVAADFPICPLLSTNTAYTSPFVETFNPSVAVAHSVASVAISLVSLNVNLFVSISLLTIFAVTFTSPLVQTFGS